MKVTSSSSNSDSIKLLQITDTHLFEPVDGSLLSVNTLDSFNAVVAAIVEENQSFDAVISTGDISQDHTAESYQRFERGIAPLKNTCFWLPGNHDFKPSMSSVLPSTQIKQVEHVLLGEHWQMVLLDSQVVGVPHGRLSDQQLALLEDKLSQYPERNTLVLLHHHPILVGSRWLDQHTLKDAHHFWEVVEKHSNVKAVLCGHVHQDMNVLHQGVRVMATPSTCVQFKPNSDDFALDTLSPGWRELELHSDGQLTTQVKRLPYGSFQPDFNSAGY
ncbi:3',5'-cyclic-AMP phosphodiesterase [Vibrio tubiashii]|uniref:3',5'-cyclic adenosine monophosphate phosphodiesterase CpdA n=1 Tax=Vibrio tubiashii ATCC 19109 TaxID=1051646 RepID=F9T647_9VIBR|nr:3',5'-cyclic-AMP phosphodiesterase [Vibrio tubiashii]AIW14989.1 3',5'-cyclic-nucleotide phosphodiesterase [Vibrio tubiashii ATCC 19109]EGU54886.1 cyclic 3',5'-adenosine monophosphate phosphodiesterase [Vibrio tubiashii ATCC 19109]EIF05617.1 cyclic 3',5'-adenosine monophosphate phosphodiesterase [Vibrio tubiashii NCIMB 1337 = ATCC 19106]